MPMADTSLPTYREIVHSTDPAIRRVHELVRRTFHANKLVGIHEWRDSLREQEAGLWSDIRWHLVLAEHQGRVVGVASGMYLGNINMGIVGYLAVGAQARGLGVGSKLRARLRASFHRDARKLTGKPLEAVIGEVRRDNPWLRSLVRNDRVLALDFTYFQPRLHPGDRLVSLVLYYEGIARPRRRLAAARIRTILYTTWRRIYRIARPLTHREFRRMLADLEGRSSVGEIHLGELPPPTTSIRS
jgi:hypothetical protein